MLNRWLAAMIVMSLGGIMQTPAPPPLLGRWNLTFQRANGATSSGWLEVRHSGTKTLVGSFVGLSGSARPISEVVVTGSEMRFTIPPQWERADGNVVVSGRLEN